MTERKTALESFFEGLCSERNQTFTDLAEKLGLSQVMLASIELGSVCVPEGFVEKVVSLYSLSEAQKHELVQAVNGVRAKNPVPEIVNVAIEGSTGEKAVSLPAYQNMGDAGMDICSAEDIVLAPGETALVHTGIRVAIPDGYELQVRPRSGLSLNTPLRVCNAPGTVDSGYRDEVCIIMQNTSERFFTDGAGVVKVMPDRENNHYDLSAKGNHKGWYHIRKGDRVAQIVLHQVPRIQWVLVEDVSRIEGSRGGGFGSTGTR